MPASIDIIKIGYIIMPKEPKKNHFTLGKNSNVVRNNKTLATTIMTMPSCFFITDKFFSRSSIISPLNTIYIESITQCFPLSKSLHRFCEQKFLL